MKPSLSQAIDGCLSNFEFTIPEYISMERKIVRSIGIGKIYTLLSVERRIRTQPLTICNFLADRNWVAW